MFQIEKPMALDPLGLASTVLWEVCSARNSRRCKSNVNIIKNRHIGARKQSSQ